ncbi:MAG: tRNA (N6-isopentenyl adenosine(37)-C2)-methylthiotransferase MiaB [Bacteroidales bacterium]|nr:tRNA (N6-isopentenyl adenosine(37)-C2)-methylthiotransferase MiaB [Bacteroidales bacterium]
MKYHILTLGCQMNMSDRERTKPVIEQMGYEWTDDEDKASLVGILACSVRQKAIDKVYSRIHKWNKRKNKENLLTFVTGCILPSDKDRFLKLFDIVFPMSELQELPEMINQYGIVTPVSLKSGQNSDPIYQNPRIKELKEKASELKLNEHMSDFWNINPHYESDFEAFVPIQNGCDKFCTFCAVPYTRGREVSRPSAEILAETQTLIDNNYKTITLLGQNVNSYGLDKKGKEISFPDLLRQIGEIGKKSGNEFWVYFTSPHPRDMTDEVIEVIAEYPNLGKQIHLPIQSGDDKVLIRMNRKYSVEKYREIEKTIRRLIPQATLFTDIIVGFTGETDEQFESTRKIMDEFKYNMAYIAQYSQRPGAVSSRWVDDIPKQVKKERYHTLTQNLMKSSLEHNNKMVGRTYRVLVRGKERKGNYLSGLTEGKINVRIYASDDSLIGKIVDVKIKTATDFSVAGELITKVELQSA